MDKSDYHILIIEDNGGDFTLIEEYIEECIHLPHIDHAETFEECLSLLQKEQSDYDVILLDLSLPDKYGDVLIEEILKVNKNIPVIVLTGFSDVEFSISSISRGISDYLLKDELTAALLYKSINYAIERKKRSTQLRSTERKYKSIFELNPQPMWVYDVETLRFLDVNMSAIKHYGFSKEEFLSMTIKEIRPLSEWDRLNTSLEKIKENPTLINAGNFRHQKKNGEIIIVEVSSCVIERDVRNVRLVNINDVTERVENLMAIEKQNKNLREIAWMQSHVLRAPLARILGLIDLIKITDDVSEENKKIIDYLLTSATDLDDVIKHITDKTSNL
jgi:PAS domain S-box-containing protein